MVSVPKHATIQAPKTGLYMVAVKPIGDPDGLVIGWARFDGSYAPSFGCYFTKKTAFDVAAQVTEENADELIRAVPVLIYG